MWPKEEIHLFGGSGGGGEGGGKEEKMVSDK